MVFHSALVESYIYLGGTQVRVAQDLSNVLDRDTLADQISGKGPAEAMWVDIAHTGLFCQDP